MATQAQIKARVKECIELAKELYGFDVDYNDIDISFKSRGQAAASASCKVNRLTGEHHSFGLRFSTESANLDSDEMLNDTVPHEVAHLVCYWKPSLGKNHDYGWRRVCIGLGGTGNRTHSQVLTKGRYKSQYVYRTDSGYEITVGPKVHKSIQLGSIRITKATRERFGREHFVRHITPDEHRREHMKKVVEYRNSNGAKPASPKRPTPKKPASPKRATGGTSKKARANAIYLGEGGSKAACIARFMSELDMSAAGASTYYYNCRRELS